jgi:hypothetical protein
MGKMRNACDHFSRGNLKRRADLGDRPTWEDNIKMNVKEFLDQLSDYQLVNKGLRFLDTDK